jgi:hypothetical protein
LARYGTKRSYQEKDIRERDHNRHHQEEETKVIWTHQQWTIGPVDGEIVPVCGEMLHPTKSHTYQGEMERKNLTIYIYIYIYI